MPKPRDKGKQRAPQKTSQPPRPPTPTPSPPALKVLPTQLQLGDRLVDEQSEWRVAGRPYTSSGGKIVSVRVESVKQPGVATVQVWGSHERVKVQRDVKPPNPEAGKR
jgi:hypothetical protein